MAPFATVQWSWVDYCLAVRLGTSLVSTRQRDQG